MVCGDSSGGSGGGGGSSGGSGGSGGGGGSGNSDNGVNLMLTLTLDFFSLSTEHSFIKESEMFVGGLEEKKEVGEEGMRGGRRGFLCSSGGKVLLSCEKEEEEGSGWGGGWTSDSREKEGCRDGREDEDDLAWARVGGVNLMSLKKESRHEATHKLYSLVSFLRYAVQCGCVSLKCAMEFVAE